MKVKLDAEKIRFRKEDSDLSDSRKLEILSGRLAGCQRVLRQGEPLEELEKVLAMRGSGAGEGLLAPWPVHPPEPYRVKSVELRGQGCPPPEVRLEAIEEAGYNTFLLKEDKRVVIHID